MENLTLTIKYNILLQCFVLMRTPSLSVECEDLASDGGLCGQSRFVWSVTVVCGPCDAERVCEGSDVSLHLLILA